MWGAQVEPRYVPITVMLSQWKRNLHHIQLCPHVTTMSNNSFHMVSISLWANGISYSNMHPSPMQIRSISEKIQSWLKCLSGGHSFLERKLSYHWRSNLASSIRLTRWCRWDTVLFRLIIWYKKISQLVVLCNKMTIFQGAHALYTCPGVLSSVALLARHSSSYLKYWLSW